jgi:hypothetical protein
MTSELRITDVRYVAAAAHARDADAENEPLFLGHVSAIFGELLVIDGFGLHAWPDGRFSISFPTRRSPSGKVHRIVRATSKRARFEVERRLLLALDQQGALR